MITTHDEQTTSSSSRIVAAQTVTSYNSATTLTIHQVPLRALNSPAFSRATRCPAPEGLDSLELSMAEPNGGQDTKIRNDPVLPNDSAPLSRALIVHDICGDAGWLDRYKVLLSNSQLEHGSGKGWLARKPSPVTVPRGLPETIPFANSTPRDENDAHIQLTVYQMRRTRVTSLEKTNKVVKIKMPQMKSSICILANVLVESLAFDSQIKEQLTLPARSIREHISNWNKVRRQQLVKSDHRKLQRPSRTAISPDANNAGSKHSKDCTLALKRHRPNARQASARRTPEACRRSTLLRCTSKINPDLLHLIFRHLTSLSAQHEVTTLHSLDDSMILSPARLPESIPPASVPQPTESTALKDPTWIMLYQPQPIIITGRSYPRDSIIASAAHVILTTELRTGHATIAAMPEDQRTLVLPLSSSKAQDIPAKVHRIVSAVQPQVMGNSSRLDDEDNSAGPRPSRGPQGRLLIRHQFSTCQCEIFIGLLLLCRHGKRGSRGSQGHWVHKVLSFKFAKYHSRHTGFEWILDDLQRQSLFQASSHPLDEVK